MAVRQTIRKRITELNKQVAEEATKEQRDNKLIAQLLIRIDECDKILKMI